MNPSDIFKSALGTAASTFAPVETGLFKLGSSLYNSLSAPKTTTTPTATLSPSTSANGYSNTSLQSTVPKSSSTAGGNVSATSPKDSYIASQTNPTSVTSTLYQNPNANYYGGQKNTTGGSTSSGSSSNPGLDAYTQAFQTYLASLQPSDAETQAEKNLAAQTLQAQKDQDYALNHPGGTVGFAAGEAGRVARNNAYQTDALTNTLNSLTGARTARTAAAKAQLDFEKGLYDDSVAAAKPDYTTVSPGATLFDQKTGKAIYTAPTTASQAGSASGVYVAGTDPIADGWVTAINNNQAKLSDVPAAYKNLVSQGLAAAGKDDALKTNALASAQQLLNSFQNSGGFLGIGGAKQAVGASSVLPVIPGTQTADFVANLDNLKSLLSLDNVKYLKGQGAVSDAERKLLADSATQLSRSQSQEQFQATLQKIITGLQQFGALNGSAATTASDVNSDPDYQAYLKAISQ